MRSVVQFYKQIWPEAENYKLYF